MTIIPQCFACIHLQPAMCCAAFPDGIPDAILLNRADHRQPFPGDHGIRLEVDPAEKGEAARILSLAFPSSSVAG
jgi:hypothetical protein